MSLADVTFINMCRDVIENGKVSLSIKALEEDKEAAKKKIL